MWKPGADLAILPKFIRSQYYHSGGITRCGDKVVQFRRQAQDCKERAAGARDPIDGDAWLKLAEEWLAFARANETARDVQKPPAAGT